MTSDVKSVRFWFATKSERPSGYKMKYLFGLLLLAILVVIEAYCNYLFEPATECWEECFHEGKISRYLLRFLEKFAKT